MTTELLTLEQYAAAAGDDEGVDMGRRPFKSPFNLATAYPVEITEQEISQTKNGYTQAVLSLGIVKSDGEVSPAGKVWVTLPTFTTEKEQSEDPEKLKQLKGIFGEKLAGLLRGVDRATFSVFDRAEKNGRNWTFYDADGSVIEKAAKTAREKALGKAVIGVAKMMEQGQFSLKGKRLFYVRVQDKTNPTKFYDQWYSVQPDKFPAAEGL